MSDNCEDVGAEEDISEEEGNRHPMCDEEAALMKVGVQVSYEEKWVGEPPNRHPIRLPDIVRNVFLPFKPDDWWELTTRDGEDYIGPCCGTTGAMQDILCGVYRDSGWIDDGDLLKLGGLGSSHDGMHDWKKRISQKALEKKVASWDKLGRWDRIGVIYRALKPRLKVGYTDDLRVGRKQTPEKEAISALYHGLAFLNYADLFERANADQNHANRLLSLARILPGLKMLTESLKEYKPFDGYALVLKSTPETALQNYHGMCVYKTPEEAQEIINISKKEKSDEALIRPVRVTVEDGLVFTG